jgi:hypothetical protein
MVVVGLDYGHAGQMTLDEITGGSPYGATTIAGGDGARQPTPNELQGARTNVARLRRPQTSCTADATRRKSEQVTANQSNTFPCVPIYIIPAVRVAIAFFISEAAYQWGVARETGEHSREVERGRP